MSYVFINLSSQTSHDRKYVAPDVGLDFFIIVHMSKETYLCLTKHVHVPSDVLLQRQYMTDNMRQMHEEDKFRDLRAYQRRNSHFRTKRGWSSHPVVGSKSFAYFLISPIKTFFMDPNGCSYASNSTRSSWYINNLPVLDAFARSESHRHCRPPNLHFQNVLGILGYTKPSSIITPLYWSRHACGCQRRNIQQQ